MRSPQSSILALLALQRLEPEKPVPTDTLERIERHARRTLDLAEEFVQLARAESSAYQMGTADLADLLAWLVEQHLLMSVTAQRQDISDPEVVARFANKVADREHLDYLYLLTCADIAGTSPKLWNAWKDRLLADLYSATRFALRRGLENPVHATEIMAETRAVAMERLLGEGQVAHAQVGDAQRGHRQRVVRRALGGDAVQLDRQPVGRAAVRPARPARSGRRPSPRTSPPRSRDQA